MSDQKPSRRPIRHRLELKSVVGSTAIEIDLYSEEVQFLRAIAANLLAAQARPGLPTLILRREEM